MREQEQLKDNEVTTLLKLAAAHGTQAIMSHLSRGKWHLTKITLVRTTGTNVQIDITQKEKHHPININIDQPVGISFKHDYCKYIFKSSVVGFEPSVNTSSGGIIVIALPDRIDRIQRRNYYRVTIPRHLNIRVLFWHRGYSDETKAIPLENYWQGQLLDISAGGLQICVDLSQRPNFRAGQLVGIQFTPMPHEKPIQIEAQLRQIAPTADNTKLCLGLQVIGLEATIEGREMLHRLCDVVKAYLDMNHRAGIVQPEDAMANIE
ncbi:MAG: PilZ domain-containing protein [Sedimentisphaerales bacterium]|nr:PilZ domain-containing protein [Sedimentisphaerales bacterium]